jgi:hypothetical protein
MLMEYGSCLNTGFNLEYAHLNPDDDSCQVISIRQNFSFTKSFLKKEYHFEDECSNLVISKQVFNGYSLFDALSLKNASQLETKKRKIPNFTPSSVLANYGGASVFSVFQKAPGILQKVLNQVTESNQD